MSENTSATGGAPGALREGPPTFDLPPDCRQQTLGVAFFDLSRISEWASAEQDSRVAAFFQGFYAQAAEHIEGAGGRIVKFMGDAGLAVFEPDAAEDVIFSLCRFASDAHGLGRRVGLQTHLSVAVHVGPVLAGSFGAPGAQRFDVIGKTVNVAARLGRGGVTLSAQAFRCLSAKARQRFEKIQRPITYRFRG